MSKADIEGVLDELAKARAAETGVTFYQAY